MTFETDVGRKLFKIKQIIKNNIEKVVIKETEKNIQAIEDLDYSDEDIYDEINSLTTKNYVKGPEADWDGSKGERWIFGKKIHQIMFYIKLKIIKLSNGEELIIMSFHPADPKKKLKFPFIQNRR